MRKPKQFKIIIKDIENLEYIPDHDDEVITPKIIISATLFNKSV